MVYERELDTGVSFQHSCTTFRTCDFSTLTCEQTSNKTISFKQKETDSPHACYDVEQEFRHLYFQSVAVDADNLTKASVCNNFELNHMRLSFSVDNLRPARKCRKVGISSFRFCRKSVSSFCNDTILLPNSVFLLRL